MNSVAFETLIAVMATISLFLFSLRGFSKELQKLGAETMQAWLTRVTRNRMYAFLLGASFTALIQSSSAVSSITVAMVDSGIITFYNSLAVLLGAKFGTTFTAWLVAFKLESIGPFLLIIGTVLGFIPHRVQIAGKTIFYLGLILFSLQLISHALEPVKESENLVLWLSYSSRPLAGVLLGIIITFIVQSSSVTTGLAIILASKELLPLEAAIAIVVGCNLGTTSTALIASIAMKRAARLAAIANFIFSFVGLISFFPFLSPFTQMISLIDASVSYQVAWAHLIFSFYVALIILPFTKAIGKRIEHYTRKHVEDGGQTSL